MNHETLDLLQDVALRPDVPQEVREQAVKALRKMAERGDDPPSAPPVYVPRWPWPYCPSPLWTSDPPLDATPTITCTVANKQEFIAMWREASA